VGFPDLQGLDRFSERLSAAVATERKLQYCAGGGEAGPPASWKDDRLWRREVRVIPATGHVRGNA
jgi:hypothetical protein